MVAAEAAWRWQRQLQRDGDDGAVTAEAEVSGATALARRDGISAAAAVVVALEWQRSGGIGVRSGRYFLYMFFLLW